MAVAKRLLDNTGAIELVTLGHNIRSHGYRALAMGSDRIELRRSNGTTDTVTVHVRERSIGPGLLIGNSGTPPYDLSVGGTVRAFSLITTAPSTVGGAQQVTWSSSDPSVATVSANGTITAVAPGIAVIMAHGTWGGVSIGYVRVRRP
jgi:hypothetical protein